MDSARWPFPWTVWVILAHVGSLFSTHRTSVGVRQHTQDVHGCLCVSVCVCGCPSAHTGHPWLSVCVHVCPCVSVCVRQHTKDVRGCPSVHISARWSFPWTVWVTLAHVGCLFSTHRMSVGVRQHTQDVHGCLWLSVSTHKTSVGVCQHTHDAHVCQSAHTGRPWLSVCVPVCPSEDIGRPWLSISTHINTLVLGLGMLTLPVDCLGDIGPRGLSVQYTQDVSECPSAHRGRPWLSVCVSLCPSEHTGRPWLSISTHISTLVLGLSTLALPMDCLGNFGTRGLSVQYTQDIRRCLPAHT